MTTTRSEADREERLREFDRLLEIPLDLSPEDLEELISLADTEEQLHDERLLEELRGQNKANKEKLKRLWAERRHVITEGLNT